VRWLDRLLRRPALPEGVVLEPEEHVVAVAEVAGGGHVVATSRGLWLPEAQRLRWHLNQQGDLEGGALAVTEAREVETVEGAVLIADEPPRRIRLATPGRVPEAVHKRVTGSIRTRHPPGSARRRGVVVQRTVAGRDGVVLQ
jgi:hypothetical protein